MKQYLSLDSITAKLNKSGIDDVKDLMLDAGQAFIYGQITSVFEKGASLSAIQSGIAAGTAAIGAVDVAKQAAANAAGMLESIGEMLIALATETITKEAASIVTKYANNHVKAVAALPGNITKQSLVYFNKNKMSVSEALKKLLLTAEERTDLAQKERELKSKKNFIDDATKIMKDISDNIEKYSTEFKDKVEKMSGYVGQGPEWVCDELNKQIDSVISQVEERVDKQWEKDKAAYDTFAEKEGAVIGEKLVQVYNNELQKVQNKIFNANKTKLDKVIVKAHKVLQVAKLKIMAKIGINLPI